MKETLTIGNVKSSHLYLFFLFSSLIYSIVKVSIITNTDPLKVNQGAH